MIISKSNRLNFFALFFVAMGFCLAGGSTGSAPLFGQETLAVTGAKVITISGDTIENGTVLIRDGKIAAVGADVEVPIEAKVVDATGQVVMPGFVHPHNSEGMSQANETNPNVPYVSVLDSIDPMRSFFDEARRNGVTTAGVIPGNSTMIGGQGAVVKTGGTFLDNMILKRKAGLKISLQPVRGSSRMGHFAALREEFKDAKELLKSDSPDEKADEDEQGDDESDTGEGDGEESTGDEPASDKREESDDESDDDEDQDEDDEGEEGEEDADGDEDAEDRERERELKQAVIELVSGKLRGFIHCDNPNDVREALKMVEEHELDAVLVLDKECYEAAEMVADAGLPVILDSDLVFWERDPRTGKQQRIVLSEVFNDHDVEFAFQTARGGSDTVGNNYLWYQAATAVKYGMPKEKALKALTITPAKILGVDQFVGSLEVGKDGDLVILTGDPLEVDTWVDKTIVEGEVVYERDKDRKLKRLLEGDTQ